MVSLLGPTPLDVREFFAKLGRADEGLVKMQFSKNADVDVKDAANARASALGADVVQVIGRTATLFRERPEEEKDV